MANIVLVEFPADDPERALRFWREVVGADLSPRTEKEGQGWQSHEGGAELGVHPRGPGPGDRVSLPYLSVPDLESSLERVRANGGDDAHRRPGPRLVAQVPPEFLPPLRGLQHLPARRARLTKPRRVAAEQLAGPDVAGREVGQAGLDRSVHAAAEHRPALAHVPQQAELQLLHGDEVPGEEVLVPVEGLGDGLADPGSPILESPDGGRV